MKLNVILAVLISVCWAEQEESSDSRSSRSPQGHIQYSDSDGSKVNWRLYAPYAQWKSHLETPQRSERSQHQESRAAHIEPAATNEAKSAQPVQHVQPLQIEYKPYAMIPTYIKQLMQQAYGPQQPYVDPAVYIYQTQGHQQQQQYEEEQEKQPAASEQEGVSQSAQGTGLYEHIPRYESKYPVGKSSVGYVQYKDEQPASSEPQQQQSYDQGQEQEDSMPHAIHQLLNLQAQTPYHVIADKIVYKPKSIFVPKPFSGEFKGPYKYRSKVYYVKGGGDEVEEQERQERDESREQGNQE